jgi:AGCS family alanine or glycine:cation symporter
MRYHCTITEVFPVNFAAVWLDSLTALVGRVNDWVWGVPLIASILAVGILLTVMLRFRHIANLRHAFESIFKGEQGSRGEV